MNKLPKVERLSGKTDIEKLFKQGKRFRLEPFLIVHRLRKTPSETSLRFGISVSKKISKKAVDRNRIKRQVREAYRTSKQELIDSLSLEKKQIDFFLVYNGEINTNYTLLKEKIILILNRLNALHGQTSKSDNHRTN
ncbi:MAG: ribonuclease P protein component [Bacteroidia bacterium]